MRDNPFVRSLAVFVVFVVAGFAVLVLAQDPSEPVDAGGSVQGGSAPLTKGDNDCDQDIDAVDALTGLLHVVSLPYGQEAGCLTLGFPIILSGGTADEAPAGIVSAPWIFGDVDCDFDVDALDALWILRYLADLPVNLPPLCPLISEQY